MNDNHVLIYDQKEQFEHLRDLATSLNTLASIYQNNTVLPIEYIADWYKFAWHIKREITKSVEAMEGIVRKNTVNAHEAGELARSLQEHGGVLPFTEALSFMTETEQAAIINNSLENMSNPLIKDGESG
jgi:hypothetical protein